MKKLYIFSLLLYSIGGLAGGTLLGQDIESPKNAFDRNVFFVDHAQFRSDQPNLSRLEIYYKIYTSSLQFVRDANHYQASYEIGVTILDRDDRQVTASTKDKNIIVDSYIQTVAETDFRTSQMNWLLPPGKYKVECQLLDKNTGLSSKKVLKVELPEYESKTPQISSVEYVQAVDTALIDSVFGKGVLTVIPAVTREFGGDSTASLVYYQEIYQGVEKKENVLIETKILDSKLSTVYHDSLTSPFNAGENILRQIREVRLSHMKSGDYVLQISVIGKRGHVVDQVRAPFMLYWPPIAMVINDYETAITQLKYIASSEETKTLKTATTKEERMTLWNEFWLAHDPSQGTPVNELKNRYYERIDYANRYFSILRKEGWRTDRGMIYIQYGEPDQIEDFPFELNAKAYQIWYYYRPVTAYDEPSNERRKFVFVDEWLNGDFKLQYPYDGRAW